jgi:hypothetical protein
VGRSSCKYYNAVSLWLPCLCAHGQPKLGRLALAVATAPVATGYHCYGTLSRLRAGRQPQPMVQQVQQALVSVYEPPTISVAKAPATITEFLHKIRLTEFEAPLFELGASSIEDLADLTETDVQELALKPLEVKRFMRAISELSYSKDV